MTDSEKQELKPIVINKLRLRVFNFERDNHKTKKYSDTEAVTKIRKMIDELVRSEDNL